MKRIILLLLFGLSFFLIIFAQHIKENPEGPSSEDAGRIVQLKEIQRITDESGKYFFRHPVNFQVAPHGDLFIQDVEQLLQFDSKGNYIRNLFRKGQGPGEMTSLRGYQLIDKGVIIYCDRPSKILEFDYEGNILKEIPIYQKKRFDTFEFYYNGRYYFLYIDWQQPDILKRVVGLPYELVSLSSDGKTLTEHMTFLTQSVIAAKGGIRGGWVPVDRMITIPWQEKYLVISHTEEYLLILFDAESQQIRTKFRRKYPRIKATDKNDRRPNLTITLDGVKFEAPKRNHLYDIEQLWVNGKFLWVLTSTLEKEKGYLVDVFDINGVYVDNFFLGLHEEIMYDYIGFVPMRPFGEFLIAAVQDENGNYIIKKYRMF